MNRDHIIKAFESLDAKLERRGAKGEIGVVGGAAMLLAFNARAATKDVDGIFFPSEVLRECAVEVARELSLPENWLNDAVKAYLPQDPTPTSAVYKGPSLTVWVPPAEYLLAMKSISARFDSQDGNDIRFLIRHLGLKTVAEVFKIVEHYYPRRLIPPKTQFFLEEFFERR